MSKTVSKFRFKQFAVSHHRSSMKVGVDGVLIGCWTDPGGAGRILDVGTGCGLIALIMAQRTPEARIDAIDIDVPSIEEASENITASPWAERIRASVCGFADASALVVNNGEMFDLIISNPPYFDSGVTETVTAREKARHQGDLSPISLLRGAKRLLNPGGSVAMVVTAEMSDSLVEYSYMLGFQLTRRCFFRGHDAAPYKRTLLQWRMRNQCEPSIKVESEYLTLEMSPGVPTEDYRELCKDFYLRF